LGGHLVVVRTLAAPPEPRRSGGRHSRGALRPLRRALVTTGGRLQLPERGRLDPGTLGNFLRALRRATAPGPAAVGTPQGRRMRRRWIDPAAQGLALSSPPRARAAAGVPHSHCDNMPHCRAALRQYAAAAPLLLDSHRVLDGPLRGRGQHRAGSLLRAGADRGCGLRLCRRVCGLAPARLRVQIPRRSRAPPPPARGGLSVREFCGPIPVPHTFFSVASPREPHYIAPPRELSCELCAVCPAHQQSGPGATAGDSVPRPSCRLPSQSIVRVQRVCVCAGSSSMLGGV